MITASGFDVFRIFLLHKTYIKKRLPEKLECILY